MRKILALMLAIVMVVGLVACGKKPVEPTEPVIEETEITEITEETEPPVIEETEPEVSEDEALADMAEALKEVIENELKDSADIRKALESIITSEVLPFTCVVEEVNIEFMPGFKQNVEGFTDAAMLLPIMSSQPFIVYLFDTADADALMQDLTEFADPRWNICTEATTTVCEKYDNFVLFAMLP